MFPKVQDTDFTERAGVIEISRQVNLAREIWRETPLRDVGIDGQIEHVDAEGNATGHLVAVQVKAGASYFSRSSDTSVSFTVLEKHRLYWARFPIPVILVLHHPETLETIWVDVRAPLRRGEHSIDVPRANRFDADGVRLALQAAGPLPTQPTDLNELMLQMVANSDSSSGFSVSFFELFLHGMTDIAYSLYFGMELISELLEYKSAQAEPHAYDIGAELYDFVDRYVEFVVAFDLARIDFDAWRQSAEERQMVAKFISPLTPRGRALTAMISAKDEELLGPRSGYSAAVQERFVQMAMMGFNVRAHRIMQLEAALTGVT